MDADFARVKNLCLHDSVFSLKMKEIPWIRDEVSGLESAVRASTFCVSGEAAVTEAIALQHLFRQLLFTAPSFRG